MDYKSQKAHFATYTDGAQGITYTLSLDNDFDVLVFDQQNKTISSLPITVKMTRQLNGDTTNNIGSLALQINSQSTWTEKHYRFYESEDTLKIIGAPDDFTEAAFQIQWKISDSSILTKTFTLKKQISNVDYEIEVDKNVINSTNLDGTVNVKVKKKDINGVKYLANTDLTTDSLTLTSNKALTWNSKGYWTFDYVKGQTEAVTITLKKSTLVWDTEIIEFVLDGKQGPTGKDGNCIEYVYYRSETEQKNLSAPSYTGTTLTTDWTPSPLGITEKYKYEYMSVRTKAAGATNWSNFSTPVIWSKWGEKGQDGDGIEYKYCLTNSEEKPVYPAPNGASYVWTDEPSGVSIENKYEYVVSIVVSPIESTAKKINTTIRNFPLEAWENYGKKGHEENWTIRDAENLDNSHIYLGDYAYVDGFVENTTTPARIYGKVIELHNSSIQEGYIRMRSTHLVIGDYKTPTSTVSLWSNYSTSPYLISFDNDSATIGADKDGNVNTTTLAAVSAVTAKVYFGQTDITDSCTFSWSVNGGALNATSGKTIYFTSMTTQTTTATATVSVSKNGSPIGNKTFTIAKSFAGQDGTPAITYKLSVSPNSINLTTNPGGVTPSFIVTKYSGSNITNITSGYTIERSDGNSQPNAAITSKTTFTLKVGSQIVDTETVEVVSNGQPGKGISSVVNYYLATTLSSGVTTSTSGWDTKVPSNFNSTNKYLWNYEKTLNTDGNVISTTDPTIIGTWGQDGKGISSIEEYYATTTTTSQPATGDWKKVPGNPMPTTDSTNKYLWNYEKINYTTGSPTTTEPAIIGTYGDTGSKGDTVKVVYAYYAKSGSSIPTTKPTNGSGILPSDWSPTPLEASPSTPFVFVSQCTVTNSIYGNWTTPTCWAKYGADGSDASVTDVNVFNALTNNGTMYGCFNNTDGKLYINAQYIKSGTVESDLVLAGNVVANDIDATGGTIAGLTMSNQKLYGIGGGNMYTNNNGQSYPFDHVMGINSVYSAAKNSYTAFWIGAKFPRKNATAGDTNSWGTVDNEGMNTVFGADDYAMAEKYITGATDVESAGGADFRVSHQGQLFARNAIIDGTIHARQGGTIGGFTIGDTYITSNTSKITYQTSVDGVYVGTDGIGLGQNKFYVSNKGVMYSESGTIGGWSISPGSISGTASIKINNSAPRDISTGMMKPGYEAAELNSKKVYNKLSLVDLSSSSRYKGIAFYAGAPTNDPSSGKFVVLNDGSLYASAAQIEGNITATTGQIGLLNIDTQGSLSWEKEDDSKSLHYIYIRPNLNKIPIESSAAQIGHWTINYNGIKGERSPSGVDEQEIDLGQNTNTLLITPNIVKFGLYGNPEIKATWLDIINSTNTISSGQTLDFYVSGRLSTELGTKTYKLSFVKGILVSCTSQ